jgi:hypothetical protein
MLLHTAQAPAAHAPAPADAADAAAAQPASTALLIPPLDKLAQIHIGAPVDFETVLTHTCKI